MDLLTSFTSSVISEIIFEGSSKNFEIDGIPFDKYLCDLADDIGKQMFDPIVFLFGQDFLKLGIRPHDRKVNEKISKFNLKCCEFVSKRIEEIKRKEN